MLQLLRRGPVIFEPLDHEYFRVPLRLKVLETFFLATIRTWILD